MTNIKKKLEYSLGACSAKHAGENWHKMEIDFRTGKAIFKRFKHRRYPTEEEVSGLCKKIPGNCQSSLERLLSKNENSRGILTPLKAYNIVSTILKLNQERGFSWNKIRWAIDKALDRGIADVRYVVGILRKEKEREKALEADQ